jgi:hypothetical protein
LAAIGDWIAGHLLPLSLLAGSLLGLFVGRRTWLDAVGVARWRLKAGRDWRNWVLGAEQLVERRARWAGRGRPHGETPTRYLANGVVPADSPYRETLVRLGEFTGWAAYAPSHAVPAHEDAIWNACRQALQVWTYRRFRSAK